MDPYIKLKEKKNILPKKKLMEGNHKTNLSRLSCSSQTYMVDWKYEHIETTKIWIISRPTNKISKL